MSDELLNLTLHVWRQAGPKSQGRMERIEATDISQDMSFLEMLDKVNEDLIHAGKEPIAFDHDCREGICGTCSLMIDGQAHGPQQGTATCQLHMRVFQSGDTIVIEPWRAAAPRAEAAEAANAVLDGRVEAARPLLETWRFGGST